MQANTAAAMKRLDAKFPRTKEKFDRVAFRVVAWQLLVSYAGRRLAKAGNQFGRKTARTQLSSFSLKIR